MLKVSMLGASSTGKTIIAKKIAEKYDLVYVDELAAKYIRDGVEFTQPQLLCKQYQKEVEAIYKAVDWGKNGFVTDSDLRLTKVYTALEYPSDTEKCNKLFNLFKPKYDLTFYTDVDKSQPIVDNGERVLGEERRQRVQSMIKVFLLDDTIYVVHSDMNLRLEEISNIVYNRIRLNNLIKI